MSMAAARPVMLRVPSAGGRARKSAPAASAQGEGLSVSPRGGSQGLRVGRGGADHLSTSCGPWEQNHLPGQRHSLVHRSPPLQHPLPVTLTTLCEEQFPGHWEAFLTHKEGAFIPFCTLMSQPPLSSAGQMFTHF